MSKLAKFLEQHNFSRVHFQKKAALTVDNMTLDDAQEVCDSLCSAGSPEAVTCDGEASRAQVRARMALLTGAAAELKRLWPAIVPKWDDGELFADRVDSVPDITVGAFVTVNHVKLGGRVQGKVIKVNRVKARVEFARGIFNVPFSMIEA